ncbi:MAG: serine protease [Fuerstiella sp.]
MMIHRILPLVGLQLLFSAAGSAKEIEELGIVRIRTETSDAQAHAYSTGTHLGNGLILTCGHCAASMTKDRTVEVQILSALTWKAVRKVRGTIIHSDRAAELGLIRLAAGHGLKAGFELAPRGYRVVPGDTVVSYNWYRDDHGEMLYSVTSHVTHVNRYLGAENIETSGRPEAGSSGAPLVTKRGGLVIGITHGALVHEDRGLHTSVEALYRFMDRQGSHAQEAVRITEKF